MTADCELEFMSDKPGIAWAVQGLAAWNSVRVLSDEHRLHSVLLQPLDRGGDVLWRQMRQTRAWNRVAVHRAEYSFLLTVWRSS